MDCPSVKGLVLLAAILINLHDTAAIRISPDASLGERQLLVTPPEPRIDYFNSLTHPEAPPAPVNEQPEPENPITPRVPVELGVQLENVINSQAFRYPNPTTTPRPGTFRSRVFVPPGLPSAFSRAPPQPQQQTYFTAPDGSLVPGISEIDQIVANNRLQQEQARRDQQDSYQAQVLRQVQQDALVAIRDSVGLITTNPGSRRRPNTVIRPQQLNPPPAGPVPQPLPGQTQALFQGQLLAQPQPLQFQPQQPQPFQVQSQPIQIQPQQPQNLQFQPQQLQQIQPQQPFQFEQLPSAVPTAPALPSYTFVGPAAPPALQYGERLQQRFQAEQVAYPVRHEQQYFQQHPQPQPLFQAHASSPAVTGVSYSRSYQVSLKKPQLL